MKKFIVITQKFRAKQKTIKIRRSRVFAKLGFFVSLPSIMFLGGFLVFATGNIARAVDASCSISSVTNIVQLTTCLSEAPTDGSVLTINLGGSFESTQQIRVANNKNIIIEGNGYAITKNMQSDFVQVAVSSPTTSLTLRNLILSGGGIAQEGTAVNVRGTLNLERGTIVRDFQRPTGSPAGIYVNGNYGGGILNMRDDSVVTDNSANGSNGGGIYGSNGATVNLYDESSVNNNHAKNNGAGIYMNNNSNLSMFDNATISGNTADHYGGGVAIVSGSSFTMLGGTISGNAAISGGGVYTNDYAKLTVNSGAAFADNSADLAHSRGYSDDAIYAAQIHGNAWTAPLMQGYNNYDINYAGGAEQVFVAFESNGGSDIASVAKDSGSKIGRPSDPTRENYDFVGWFTDKDLTSAYDFDAPITSNITLYAEWTEDVIGDWSASANVASGQAYAESSPEALNKTSNQPTIIIPGVPNTGGR